MCMFFMILAHSCHFQSKKLLNLANFSPHFERIIFFWPDTHCKNFQAQREGFVYKFRREKDQNLGKNGGGLVTLAPHGVTLQLQNESWLHSAKRLIFFQVSETVPQLENTLPVMLHVFFSRILLRDSSNSVCERVQKNTLATSKEGKAKIRGPIEVHEEEDQRRLPRQIPSQNHMTQRMATQVLPIIIFHFCELKIPVTDTFEQ